MHFASARGVRSLCDLCRPQVGANVDALYIAYVICVSDMRMKEGSKGVCQVSHQALIKTTRSHHTDNRRVASKRKICRTLTEMLMICNALGHKFLIDY